MVKLVLPGTELVPILTIEQAKRIPEQLLEKLFSLGDHQDFGDLIIITIKPSPQLDHSLIRCSVLWILHGANAPFLKHGPIEVSREGSWPVRYVPATHDDDLEYTATADTHHVFCMRLKLYISAASFGLLDLKGHVSGEICAPHYPVFKDEIVCMLDQLTSADLIHDLQTTDPQLSRFIAKRLQCMQAVLAANDAILPTLRGCISARERLISVIRHADDYIVDEGVRAICGSIEDSLEATAILDALIEKNPAESVISTAGRHSVALTHSSGERGEDDDDGEENDDGGQDDDDEEDDIPQRTRSSARRARNSNPPTPASFATAPGTQLRNRRPRPSSADFDFSHRQHAGLNRLTLKPPVARNEYWSVTPQRWNELSAQRQKTFAHAGLMCETDLGVSLPDVERCANCKKGGVSCDIYVEEDVTAHASRSCAYCITRNARCYRGG